MKLTLAIHLFLSTMTMTAINAATELDATGKVWAFASSGIHVFTANGKQETLHRHQDEVCQSTPTSDDPGIHTTDCRYVQGVDDGERYVWVSNSRLASDDRPEHHRYYMDVYDRTTAHLVASIPTCSVVRNVEYAKHRREIWNNCWINSGMEIPSEGQIDVFSTSALGGHHEMVVLGEIAHEHGNVFIDEALPLMAFGFSTSGGTLFEIEPNTKEVVAEIDIPGSTAGGEYAFSRVNKHLFIRNYNDCSCGVDKDTGVACEASRDMGYKGLKNVTVTTGPNANPDEQQDGFSGKFCRGSKADTNGVWEYEPSTRRFLQKHVVIGAYGAKPFNTPDGEFVLLAAGDGSNSVAVLKPGRTGEASKMLGTILLSFGNAEGKHDASDIDFVRNHKTGKLVALFSSVLHNHVVVADLTGFYSATPSNPITIDDTFDVLLHEGDNSSARWDPRGINSRRIRVIPESNYFWVDAPELDKVFVVETNFKNIRKTKIVQDISGLDAKDIVYVAPSIEHKAQQESYMIARESSDIVSMVLSSIAIVAVIFLLVVKGKSEPVHIQDKNENDTDKEKDIEDPSIDLPSIR